MGTGGAGSTSGSGTVGGSQEVAARLKIQDIFSQSQAPNAGTINVVVQNKDNVLEVETLRFDPQMAVHFRNHAALQGRELDPAKLTAAGVRDVQTNATYYAFPDFARAVVQDYNSSMKTGVTLYNQLSSELGYGQDQALAAPSPVRDISQYNDFSGWDTVSRMLEGAQSSANRVPGSVNPVLLGQVDAVQESLARAGANAASLSAFHFETVKPPAPGMEVPAFNYDSLRPDQAGGGAAGAPKPR